uniref:DNA primase n=1 Tax=Mimivirus LCMiAC01 TaxID=2506608 RepID=A0A481Z0U1_9VIRU|nr:MAG: DNA primase [Mimivirus LCMiAC01]
MFPAQYKLPIGCNQSDVNYLSMGINSGNFNIPNSNKLYHFIIKNNKPNPKAMYYCFVEKKTPYYILFWDFDINDKTNKHKISCMLDYFNDNEINFRKFWKYIIKYIIKALQYYISGEDDLYEYIYSNRSDKIKHKLHIYFPNIIVNNEYALTIRNKALEYVRNNNIYNIPEKYLNQILDGSVFKANGLRLMYQSKSKILNGTFQHNYYKINKKKSTCKNISDDKVKQLQLVSLKCDASNINFRKKIVNGIVLIDKDVIINHKKKANFSKVMHGNKVLLKDTYDQEYIRELAYNLSATRLHYYNTWLSLMFLFGNYGWCDLAHEISKKDNKYNKYYINKLMQNGCATEDPYTVSSLEYWSHVDNPEQHLKIIQKYKIDTNKDQSKLLKD